MTAAARPSPARKVTRKSQERQDEAAKDLDIWFKVDDVIHHVSPMELTGLDERRIRLVAGLPFAFLADQFSTAPGIDTLAAMMWVSAIQSDPTTTDAAYEAFMGRVTYGTEVEIFDEKPDEAVEVPEA